MANSEAFDLYSTGQIIDGFEEAAVVESFSGLFNCTQDKAVKYATSKKVIRKDIDQATAQQYATKLRGIGLDVSLIPRTPPPVEPAAANGELSLAPIDNEPEQNTNESSTAIPDASANASAIAGASVSRSSSHNNPSMGASTAANVQSKSDYANQQREQAATRQAEIDEFNNVEPFLKAMIGPIIAAFVGALLWAIIVKVGYEFGLIALAVGGMIGWVANKTEFVGFTRGVICALLCAAAIFGGKFIGYSWVYDDLMGNTDVYVNAEGVSESWEDMYAREAAELRAMDQTDSNLKQFMLDNEYAYNDTPVTQDDIDYFREYQIPEIEQMAGLSTDELSAAMAMDEMPELSVWGLVFLGLGKVDILFLIVGMGAAFRSAND